MHDITKQLMIALSIADVAVGLFGFFDYLFGRVLVLVVITLLVQMVGLNIISAITVVCFIAVSQPLRLHTIVTMKRVIITLCCATIPSIILFCSLITSSTDAIDPSVKQIALVFFLCSSLTSTPDYYCLIC